MAMALLSVLALMFTMAGKCVYLQDDDSSEVSALDLIATIGTVTYTGNTTANSSAGTSSKAYNDCAVIELFFSMSAGKRCPDRPS